jgi:hypothetical protein
MSLKAVKPPFVGHPGCVVELKTMFGTKTGWQFMGCMMWVFGGGGAVLCGVQDK